MGWLILLTSSLLAVLYVWHKQNERPPSQPQRSVQLALKACDNKYEMLGNTRANLRFYHENLNRFVASAQSFLNNRQDLENVLNSRLGVLRAIHQELMQYHNGANGTPINFGPQLGELDSWIILITDALYSVSINRFGSYDMTQLVNREFEYLSKFESWAFQLDSK